MTVIEMSCQWEVERHGASRAPMAIRSGVGTTLVKEIERITRTHGLARLQLDSSITATPFYSSLGYVEDEHTFHIRKSGLEMTCIKMSKELTGKGTA